jgi:hypothetical protein
MERDPSSLAAEIARATACFINLLGLFASPRLIAKARPSPSREHILEHIEDFLGVLAHASRANQTGRGGDWKNSEPHVLRLRELFREWAPPQGVSSEITQIARACLLALGISEPPGGWDVLEQGSAEDSSSAASQEVIPTPVDEARKVAWSFINWAGVFVIPAFLACHDPRELRAELLGRIGRYLDIVDCIRGRSVPWQDDRGLLRLEPYALKLRTLLEEWDPVRSVPPEIIETADACLKSIGVRYPPADEEP